MKFEVWFVVVGHLSFDTHIYMFDIYDLLFITYIFYIAKLYFFWIFNTCCLNVSFISLLLSSFRYDLLYCFCIFSCDLSHSSNFTVSVIHFKIEFIQHAPTEIKRKLLHFK